VHLLKRIATTIGVIALVVAGTAMASANASTRSDVVGHLYVNDNTAAANTIAAFDRHGDGTLTPMRGSPFATGGAGTGTAIGSQGALQMTDDGRFLLAVDAGSNQISVLRISSDGTLRRVQGGLVSSGGVQPVSIAVHRAAARDEHRGGDHGGSSRHLVYVANAGTGGTNYTGFTLSSAGRLRPLAGSTISLPAGSQPGDVLFNKTGRLLAGTRVGTSLIDSFAVGRDGRLAAAPGSPFPAQGLGPFGSEFRPTNARQLFVSNAHNPAPDSGTVSAFRVAANGRLTSIGSSPFPNNQTAPCWVEISHDGRFLFTVNTAVPSISRYSIAADGSLSLLGSTPFKASPVALAPQDARLSPAGDTLWVVDTGGRAVSAFAVHRGDLSELSSSPTPLPAGSAPFGIVVT
jgi:6-phosphogluconolactonase